MLNLQKLPARKSSLKKLQAAEDYFAQHWLLGTSFINKTEINKKFGRGAANVALARYFILEQRGSNVSRKLTQLRPRDLDDLPEERQSLLLKSAVEQNIEVALSDVIEDPPTEYDAKSVICVIKSNLKMAVDWCIENRKFQYIKPVRILLSRQIWDVYYSKKSHRFYAKWPFCITNWPSILRRMILSGVDYDLANAIGQFILEKTSNNINAYPCAKKYLDNPKVMREELIKVLGISETQAKKVLHATTNGAAVTQSSLVNGKSALLEIIALPQALEYIIKFSDLINQLKKLRKMIAPNAKEFMNQYFEWELQKTGTFFSGTGLIMHDGLDGCSLSTVIPAEFSNDIKMSEARGVWDEASVVDRIIVM